MDEPLIILHVDSELNFVADLSAAGGSFFCADSVPARTPQLLPGARIIAGGTNLLDFMKRQVETPSALIDIGRLPLDKIEETPEGGLRIARLFS
jgi:hypothetical protein